MLRGKEVFAIPHDSETALDGWGNECLTRWPTAAALGFTTLWIFYTQHNKPLTLLHFAQQTIWRTIWSLLCFIEPAQPISTKSRGRNSARQAGELVNPGFHHPHYHYNTCGLCWLLFKLFSYSCVFFNGILLLPWRLVEASRGSATSSLILDPQKAISWLTDHWRSQLSWTLLDSLIMVATSQGFSLRLHLYKSTTSLSVIQYMHLQGLGWKPLKESTALLRISDATLRDIQYVVDS